MTNLATNELTLR